MMYRLIITYLESGRCSEHVFPCLSTALRQAAALADLGYHVHVGRA